MNNLPKMHLPNFVFKNIFWVLNVINLACWFVLKCMISKDTHKAFVLKYANIYKVVNAIFWFDIFVSMALIIIPVLQMQGKIASKINLDKPWINKYQNFAFITTLFLYPPLRIYEKYGFDFSFILLLIFPTLFLYVIKKGIRPLK